MKDRSSHRARVLRYGGEAGARVDDQLAAEEPLELRIAGQPLTLMMRTPGHDRDLALGFLFGEGIIRTAEDVKALTVVPNGEHPDLENVIGYATGHGLLPLDRHILMVSGRTSFEIVQKALQARIPVLVAVSAPSSLARDLAQSSNQTLIGFLRGRSLNVYSGRQRIRS